MLLALTVGGDCPVSHFHYSIYLPDKVGQIKRALKSWWSWGWFKFYTKSLECCNPRNNCFARTGRALHVL